MKGLISISFTSLLFLLHFFQGLLKFEGYGKRLGSHCYCFSHSHIEREGKHHQSEVNFHHYLKKVVPTIKIVTE